ncbi:MAG: leucyl aminopeptidase family protein [Rhodospirillales bacterium]|nr:leucyl aminopeptidase family protein [Rhodospirillales bacterium]
MTDTLEICTAAPDAAALPLHAVRPDGTGALFDALPASQAGFLRATGFAGALGDPVLLPGCSGLGGAVLGLGADRSPFAFGAAATRLPEGTVWRLVPGEYDPADAVLGFCLGAYRFAEHKRPKREPARLAVDPASMLGALADARAIWFARDLINRPPNLLGPAELADAAAELGRAHGAAVSIADGAALEAAYPAVAAVGRGSLRAPRVATLRWAGPGAGADAPLIALCGKGVCFDTGGYDLKPSAAMLRMKKDMGGAAVVLGLAARIMEAKLKLRLVARIGCVENSVSGNAMRPSDVLATRAGISVEVGNTDAEGRLVLCDLLAEAAAEHPALLIDCATLTGAARVALGPDLPALFCNDDGWADMLLESGAARHDPLWRMPLWDGYASWLDSAVADVNNVSSKPFAGAVTAALFLRRFVPDGIPWAHIDLYAWNDTGRPGRPEGGEAQALRAMFGAIAGRFAS